MTFLVEVAINILTLQLSIVIGEIIHILHTLPGAIMATASLILITCIMIQKRLRDPKSVILRTVIRSAGNFTALVLTLIFRNKPTGIINVSKNVLR